MEKWMRKQFDKCICIGECGKKHIFTVDEVELHSGGSRTSCEGKANMYEP
jgi:hypothetical protein